MTNNYDHVLKHECTISTSAARSNDFEIYISYTYTVW